MAVTRPDGRARYCHFALGKLQPPRVGAISRLGTLPAIRSVGGDRMNRREFISFVGGAIVWPLETRAQQASKGPIIGVLWHAANEEEEGIYLTSLRQGFQDLGYGEGSNLRLENRFAAERYEKFLADAKELVALKVDVLVAVTRPAA